MELNEQQQQAVDHLTGPILVIAGAGSGKTRVITQRIAALLNKHSVAPEAILALTFTNKAALEMKERVARLLPYSTLPTITTFHGYCLQLLRKYGSLVALPSFTILDSDDQLSLIQGLLKKNNLEKQISAKTIAHTISNRKNNLASATFETSTLFQEIFTAYEREKMLSKTIDFDDLLVYTHRLFQEGSFKALHQNRIRHLLVDEYQDTNLIQHSLLKKMAGSENQNLVIDSLCVVGDEDQSIYAWRGATVTNILNFSGEFTGTTSITMEQNYRSEQQILDVANAIIINNSQRNPKKLWSTQKNENCVAQITCASGYQESEVLIQAIKAMRTKQVKTSMACLYRAHHQSRIIEEALIRSSIPYKIIGGIQFYERKEIKDILAYLRCSINPQDRISSLRILNCPPRGLGQKFEELLEETWQSQPFSDFFSVMHYLLDNNLVNGKRAEELTKLVHLLQEVKEISSPCKAVELIIAKTNYYSYLSDAFDEEEAETKKDNIKELLRAFVHFESQGITTLEHLLQEITLMQEKSSTHHDEQEIVFLMTCHAAKGLEFDFVMLVGLEEGMFPSGRGTTSPEQVQEERRLLYVGITRARQKVLLTHARSRYTYGALTDQKSSRFLQEIPKHLVAFYDVSKEGFAELQAIVRQWLVPRPYSTIAPTQNNSTRSFSGASKPQIPQCAWTKNQIAHHSTFGMGVVQEVEIKSDGIIYLIVRFGNEEKKIKADFLKKV